MMKAKTLVLLATVAVVALGSHLGRIRPAPGPCRRPRPGDSNGRSVQSLVRRDPSDMGHSQRHRLAEPVPGVLGRMGERVHVLQRCELGHGRERLSRRAGVLLHHNRPLARRIRGPRLHQVRRQCERAFQEVRRPDQRVRGRPSPPTAPRGTTPSRPASPPSATWTWHSPTPPSRPGTSSLPRRGSRNLKSTIRSCRYRRDGPRHTLDRKFTLPVLR